MIMGCYGIGITRLMATIIEQHHDEQGMIWPAAIAPYQVHLIPVSMQDTAQQDASGTAVPRAESGGCPRPAR